MHLTSIIQSVNIITNALLLLLLVFYFFYLRIKERALNKKETKIDADYHQIIDDALSRERKILSDTSEEANQIIAGAQYINAATKEAVDKALEKMVSNLEQGTVETSQQFVSYYLQTLKEMTNQSILSFQNATKELEKDLENQIKDYHNSILPNLDKEVENYRQSRLKQVETSIQRIVQNVSEDVLARSISLDDQERLIVEALDRAKAEGIFD